MLRARARLYQRAAPARKTLLLTARCALNQGRGCSEGSPGESYLFNNAGNNGGNTLKDKGVNVSNW